MVKPSRPARRRRLDRSGSWSAPASWRWSWCFSCSDWRPAAATRAICSAPTGRRSTGLRSRPCCSSSRVLAGVLVPLAWFVLPGSVRAIGVAYVTVALLVAARADRARLRVRRGQSRRIFRRNSATSRQGLQTLSRHLQRAPRRLQPAVALLQRRDRAALAPGHRVRDRRVWSACFLLRLDHVGAWLLAPAAAARRGPSLHAPADDRPTPRARRSHRLARAHARRASPPRSSAPSSPSSLARSTGWLQRVDPRAKLGMFLPWWSPRAASTSLAVLLGAVRWRFCSPRAPAACRSTSSSSASGSASRSSPASSSSRRSSSSPGPRLFELGLGTAARSGSRSLPVWQRGRLRGSSGRERVAGGAAGADHAVGGPAQEPAGAARAAGLRPGAVDDLPLHLSVPAHCSTACSRHGRAGWWRGSPAARNGRWIARSMGALMSRSFKMSNDVYTAMVARGFNRHDPNLHDLPDASGRLGGAGRARASLALPDHPNRGVARLHRLRAAVAHRPASRSSTCAASATSTTGARSPSTASTSDLYSGEQVALLGANGSGKSTLLKLLERHPGTRRRRAARARARHRRRRRRSGRLSVPPRGRARLPGSRPAAVQRDRVRRRRLRTAPARPERATRFGPAATRPCDADGNRPSRRPRAVRAVRRREEASRHRLGAVARALRPAPGRADRGARPAQPSGCL